MLSIVARRYTRIGVFGSPKWNSGMTTAWQPWS